MANDTTVITNTEDAVTRQLAETQLINEIKRTRVNAAYWDIFSINQRKEVLALIFASAIEPKITDITDAILQVKNTHGIRITDAPQTDGDKKAARKARREKRKANKMSENGETTENGNGTRKIRGGANTMILSYTDGTEEKIVRFRIRKKGAPKYEETSTVTNEFTINGELRKFVFNPSETRESVRTGFREGDNWMMLDNEEFADFAKNEKNLEFTKIEPGTEVPATEGDETETSDETPAPKKRGGRKSKSTDEQVESDVQEQGEMESDEQTSQE